MSKFVIQIAHVRTASKIDRITEFVSYVTTIPAQLSIKIEMKYTAENAIISGLSAIIYIVSLASS